MTSPVGARVIPRRADVVVVGAGSAGCIIAERLSREAGRHVVVLEAGPGWPGNEVTDLSTLPIGADSPWVSVYPEPNVGAVVRGRGVGGSAAVNGGYFMRWHAADFEHWPDHWRDGCIDRAYDELDGPSGTMAVHPYRDDELGDAARAFERFWSRRVAVREHAARWPIVGLNRVLTNSAHGLRVTSAQTYLRPAMARPNISLFSGIRVFEVVTQRSRVTGVRIADGHGTVIDCDEVILSAGTLGTAGILLRSSGLMMPTALPIGEHREILVTYRRRQSAPAVGLLQSVVHTESGLEIRCYSDSFDRYISGSRDGVAAIGVAAMLPESGGEITLRDGDSALALADPAPDVLAELVAVSDEVVDMLNSADFDPVVLPGSVVVDPVVRTSQHAWGTMPMGERTDPFGAVQGVRGLRIVDGSILPTTGRSGPHATTMMLACRIGDAISSD